MAERWARIPARAAGRRELSARDWRVLIAIGVHVDRDGEAFPSLATIARATGIDRKNVPFLIRRLERLGFLRRSQRVLTTGGPEVNLYRLTFSSEEPASASGTGGVLNAEDRGCPQNQGQGVLNAEAKVSSTLRTKQPIEHTHALHASRERVGATLDEESAKVFERFWNAYPSRRPHSNPRKPAAEKFAAALKRGIDPEAIIRGAENYRLAVEGNGTEPRYVAQAVTWLAQDRWNDHREAPEPPRLRVRMI